MRNNTQTFRYLTCSLLAAIAVAGSTSVAHAHFLWAQIDGDGQTASLYFGEGATGLTDGVPLERISNATAWTANKKSLDLRVGNAARVAKLPAGAKVVGAQQYYGVLDKTEGGRGIFRLDYYAKGASTIAESSQSVHLPYELLGRADDKVPGGAVVKFVKNGKPVPSSEIVVQEPGDEKGQKITTDANGEIRFVPSKPGMWGLRAGLAENKDGEYEGKKYGMVRSYTTLAFRVGPLVQTVAAATLADSQVNNPNGEGNPKADPAAYALLKKAHDSRRVMPPNFPGFTADLVFSEDGKVHTGTVKYVRQGKTEVTLEGAPPENLRWVQGQLMNALGHRRGGDFAKGDGKNPLTFGKDPDNYFGKLIELNDGMQSSYRVRDNVVTEVTRVGMGSRFTVSVVDTLDAGDNKYLANHFTVAYRDEKSGALQKFEAYRDNYSEFNGVWLPTMRVVLDYGTSASPVTRMIRLKDIKVLPAG